MRAVDPHPGDNILEIGAGHGALTGRLAATGAQITAVELDADLIPELQRLPVRVLHADALEIEPGQLFDGGYKLVGNIPYYISSALLRHFLEAQPRPERLVLMLQAEVAQRIAAVPGELSLLALSVQLFGCPEIVRLVPATCFRPVPKVESAILRVVTFPRPAVPLPDPDHFFRVVRAGFAEPRKQLHNSLQRNYKPSGAHLPALLTPNEVLSALEQAGVHATRRAGTVTLAEWATIASLLRASAKPEAGSRASPATPSGGAAARQPA